MPDRADGAPQPIPEWRDVDARTFREDIATRYLPAVLKGVVHGWPAVAKGRESAAALVGYLGGFDSGKAVDALMTPAHARGRIFYNDDMSGFNFTHDKLTVSAVNEKLLRYAKFEQRPAIAAQSALIDDCLPGLARDIPMPLLDDSIRPRIWIGNAVVTPAHFDESSNIACVVAGRRRFTLLPPEQVANLYIGPVGHAPTGTPISLVSFREPDFERFPRFRAALAAALVAELEPGDALYIPPLWWHHVESLEKYNVLVNYWWKGSPEAPARGDSALDCLLHCMLNLRHLPPGQRAAWRAMFDHYVFGAGEDTAAHIPAARRGVLGPIDEQLARDVRAFLVKKLGG